MMEFCKTKNAMMNEEWFCSVFSDKKTRKQAAVRPLELIDLHLIHSYIDKQKWEKMYHNLTYIIDKSQS